MRVGHVQGIAAAGVVHVVASVVGDEAVIGRVVDAAKAERGAKMVPLRGMVVDHVQYHLDPLAVERLDHGLELHHLLA